MSTEINNITFRPFEHGYDIYRESITLRNMVLLEPFNRPESCDDFDFPEKDVYIGAFLGERLLGTVILTPVDEKCAQMRQLAVHPHFRKKGIGSKLVEIFENTAKEMGFIRIVLHARESALAYYVNHGYVRQGERFYEIDMPHWEMDKELGSGDGDS